MGDFKHGFSLGDFIPPPVEGREWVIFPQIDDRLFYIWILRSIVSSLGRGGHDMNYLDAVSLAPVP